MRRLALFARPPLEGGAKTRLSPALPPALVRELYGGMLADALSAIAGAAADERFVYWADDPGGAPVTLPPGTGARRQSGAGLGARLAAAFEELLAPPCRGALIAGADAPDLSAAALDAAFAALEAADLVLAPSADGGYGLIGLRRPAPGLFEGVAWSTPTVREETLARAARAGLGVALVQPLDDIDTPADLARWIGRRAAGAGSGARHTCAALARMGLLPRTPDPPVAG